MLLSLAEGPKQVSIQLLFLKNLTAITVAEIFTRGIPI